MHLESCVNGDNATFLCSLLLSFAYSADNQNLRVHKYLLYIDILEGEAGDAGTKLAVKVVGASPRGNGGSFLVQVLLRSQSMRGLPFWRSLTLVESRGHQPSPPDLAFQADEAEV